MNFQGSKSWAAKLRESTKEERGGLGVGVRVKGTKPSRAGGREESGGKREHDVLWTAPVPGSGPASLLCSHIAAKFK